MLGQKTRHVEQLQIVIDVEINIDAITVSESARNVSLVPRTLENAIGISAAAAQMRIAKLIADAMAKFLKEENQ